MVGRYQGHQSETEEKNSHQKTRQGLRGDLEVGGARRERLGPPNRELNTTCCLFSRSRSLGTRTVVRRRHR